VIVLSALPEGGLTTLVDVAVSETDRLMRDFFAIEDKHAPEREFENVEQCFYDSKAGESPANYIRKLSLRYPNVYVARDLVNEESAKLLMEEVVKEERVLVTAVHARDAAETLLRALQKGLPRRDFAEKVVGVLNTRLIRLLCPDCKVGYAPTPDLLKKLGIPAGKVETLYRTPKPEEVDKPCKKCAGVGFFGRTGLFELLVVDDQVREVLLKKPELELLRKAARMAGMRTLQEEGVLLVAKGATSLPELSRVLKME
jgi:type II secretory ATPase GspE/PulE/Tfp pilus assembly ATPase PilB-like protein